MGAGRLGLWERAPDRNTHCDEGSQVLVTGPVSIANPSYPYPYPHS